MKRLVDTRIKYGMEINIEKSQVMRVSRGNESMRIKLGKRELNEVPHINYLISLMISKLNVKLR